MIGYTNGLAMVFRRTHVSCVTCFFSLSLTNHRFPSSRGISGLYSEDFGFQDAQQYVTGLFELLPTLRTASCKSIFWRLAILQRQKIFPVPFFRVRSGGTSRNCAGVPERSDAIWSHPRSPWRLQKVRFKHSSKPNNNKAKSRHKNQRSKFSK